MTVLQKEGQEGADSISLNIIEEVANDEDVALTDLPPLHDAVETDALEALFASHENGHLLVEFTYLGYRVAVDSDTQVRVEPI